MEFSKVGYISMSTFYTIPATVYKFWFSFWDNAALCTSDDKILTELFSCSLILLFDTVVLVTKSRVRTKSWSTQSAGTKVITWQTCANTDTITASLVWNEIKVTASMETKSHKEANNKCYYIIPVNTRIFVWHPIHN